MNTTPPPTLCGPRADFPTPGHGFFRTFKWWIMAFTLGIYYLTPWVRWDRGPALPDQAVLIDLANRRFYFFWIEIWPHEFYFVAGLLIMAGLGLFLFTSALGPCLVRLCLPANRLDRSVYPRGTLDRGRPQRACPPLESQMGPQEMAPAPDQMGGLACDRCGNWRGLGVLFHRRAHACA